jgi:hypothetical protein
MVAKKEERKKEKREKRKDDRMLIRSDLTIFNLIFSGPERTEEKWQSQGICGYIHPPSSLQKFMSNYGSTPTSSGSP